MKHFFLVSLILIIFGIAEVGYGQTTSLHPYVGGSLNFFGATSALPGWGIDAGVKYKFLYAGGEYGSYGHQTATVALIAGASYHAIFENYYGGYGGAIINDNVYLGIVFLQSYHQDVMGKITSYFNIGPDVRLRFSQHFLLGMAFTSRRGVKIGIDFLF